MDSTDNPEFNLDKAWQASAIKNESPSFIGLIESLRHFLDGIAGAALDETEISLLAQDVQSWSRKLSASVVEPGMQPFGRQFQAPGRGSTMLPPFVAQTGDERSVSGTLTFGRYFSGAGSTAVHGGAITLLFDDVLGRLANSGGPPRARTAYLRTEFRAVTPIDTPLVARAWFVSVEGRKRLLRGDLKHNGVLCAEAEGLFVVLKPGQP
jgi:acyl-coenzyme A thioesterase PaaI-like protein